ncbi:MAG: hypothetical protein ABGY96_23770 [bacterium]|nr:hypothetical protein [Gammaproteobacteria bacterium]
MDNRSIDRRRSKLEEIRSFLEKSENRVIDRDYAHGIIYTAAVVSNSSVASEIAGDLHIPVTSRIKNVAAKASRFAMNEEELDSNCEMLPVDESQDDDAIYFLVCALAASFIKNFSNYKILRKLLSELNHREAVAFDVISLTSSVQLLVARSNDVKTSKKLTKVA